jgi:hypothetical protein
MRLHRYGSCARVLLRSRCWRFVLGVRSHVFIWWYVGVDSHLFNCCQRCWLSAQPTDSISTAPIHTVSSELSLLVSLTEICHLCWLPGRGNGAVVQVLANHVSLLLSVNETQLWSTYQCSFWTNYVTTTHLHGSKVLTCHWLSARLWLTGWLGFGRVLVHSRLRQQPKV